MCFALLLLLLHHFRPFPAFTASVFTTDRNGVSNASLSVKGDNYAQVTGGLCNHHSDEFTVSSWLWIEDYGLNTPPTAGCEGGLEQVCSYIYQSSINVFSISVPNSISLSPDILSRRFTDVRCISTRPWLEPGYIWLLYAIPLA